MRRFTSLVVVMLAVSCGSGDSSPGGSGGAIAGSGGGGGAGGSGGSGGAGGTGGTGGTGGALGCTARKAACVACVHDCNGEDLLKQCLQGEPQLCTQVWNAFLPCICTAGSDETAWDACEMPVEANIGIEGVVLADCLKDDSKCKSSCFGP